MKITLIKIASEEMIVTTLAKDNKAISRLIVIVLRIGAVVKVKAITSIRTINDETKVTATKK